MTAHYPRDDGKYYSDQEVAKLLGISVGRLRNKISANSPLPPRIQPPGCRHRLWLRDAVHDWLDQFTVIVSDPDRNSSAPKRRGRPTKKEMRARHQ